MNRTERFYRICQLLEGRRAVSRQELLDDLGISPATFKRDLEYLRDRLHAPIAWDRKARGYRFEASNPDAPPFSLPGLWFSASEVHALLTMHHLLDKLQPGLLSPHIEPLRVRIQTLLDQGDHSPEEVQKRIRLLNLGSRPVEPRFFEIISSAVLSRRRLKIRYYVRQRDQQSSRLISPQRLVHYRENWYLDGWCHEREALRCFAVESIRHAELVDKRAKTVSERTLKKALGAGYGIFSGEKTHTAKLRFTPERARWVSSEAWHSRQRGHYDSEGYYLLEFPYADQRELIMDILRHGPHVEVVSPASLRRAVQQQLEETLAHY
jgi:predicted DNA-binding transcriptional regulator YafY